MEIQKGIGNRKIEALSKRSNLDSDFELKL